MRVIIILLFIILSPVILLSQWTKYNVNMEVIGKLKIRDRVYFPLNADSGKVWVCINDSTGEGEWRSLSGGSSFNRDSVIKYSWGLTGNTGAAGNWLGTNNNTSIYFKTNNTDRVIIDSNGRVGIGTTTPAYPLHVKVPTGYLRGINLEMDLSGGGSTVFGQYINATGVVPNTNGNRYGLYSDLYTNISYTGTGATRNTLAIAGVVRGSVSGTSAYGGYFIANGGGVSGATYGIYSETTNTGSSFSYAGYFKNSNWHPFNRYGVYSLVDGAGGSASTTYGVYSSANTSNNGTAYGVYGTTNNNSQTGANYYGGMFTTAGAAANSYGVRGSATGAATNNYGGYFTATGASNNYGLIVSAGLAGVNITTPTAQLHVKGTGATNATFSLKIENSAATSLLQVRDDGVSAFASLDSVTAYALTTPPAGGIVYCNNCTGNGITGRLLAYIASAWRRITFE